MNNNDIAGEIVNIRHTMVNIEAYKSPNLSGPVLKTIC